MRCPRCQVDLLLNGECLTCGYYKPKVTRYDVQLQVNRLVCGQPEWPPRMNEKGERHTRPIVEDEE
jgi:hypothetical protein